VDTWTILTFVRIDLQVELVSTEKACATIHELTCKPVDWIATRVGAVVLGCHTEDTIMAVQLRVDQASWLEDGP